jgi:hypothetical protein
MVCLANIIKRNHLPNLVVLNLNRNLLHPSPPPSFLPSSLRADHLSQVIAGDIAAFTACSNVCSPLPHPAPSSSTSLSQTTTAKSQCWSSFVQMFCELALASSL